MSDQPDTPQPDEDVEGHRIKFKMDQQAATEDDAEGHGARWGGFDAEAVTEDDVEGHRFKFKMDQQAATEDDVEGHVNFIEPDGPQDQA